MGNKHLLVMASGKQIKGGHTYVFGENDTRAVHDACPKALQTKTTISLGEMKRLCGLGVGVPFRQHRSRNGLPPGGFFFSLLPGVRNAHIATAVVFN